jgi:hypothetical protein
MRRVSAFLFWFLIQRRPPKRIRTPIARRTAAAGARGIADEAADDAAADAAEPDPGAGSASAPRPGAGGAAASRPTWPRQSVVNQAHHPGDCAKAPRSLRTMRPSSNRLLRMLFQDTSHIFENAF